MSHSNRPIQASFPAPSTAPAQETPVQPTEAAPIALPAQITTISNAPSQAGGTTVVVVPPIVIMPPTPAPQPPVPVPTVETPGSPPPSFDEATWAEAWAYKHHGGCRSNARCHRRNGCRGRRFARVLVVIAFLGVGVWLLARLLNPWAVAFRGLHLDPDQAHDLRQIYASALHGHREERAEIRAIEDRFLSLLQKDKPTQQETDALIEHFFAKQKERLLKRSAALLKAHATLTPEQRYRLASNLKRLRDRRDRWQRRIHRAKLGF